MLQIETERIVDVNGVRGGADGSFATSSETVIGRGKVVSADIKTVEDNRKIIERDVVVNGMHIHVKSVFDGDIPLEKALANIVRLRLTGKDKNNKS